MKRVARLLANRAWSAELVEEWLLEQADQLVAQQEDVALVALDQSVQEKAESLAAQGALSGRSSKARRLERPRLALVTLAYAFLVWLLTQPGERVAALLRLGCHRTGQQTVTRRVRSIACMRPLPPYGPGCFLLPWLIFLLD